MRENWHRLSNICDNIRAGKVTPSEMKFFHEHAHPILFRSIMNVIAMRAIDNMFEDDNE